MHRKRLLHGRESEKCKNKTKQNNSPQNLGTIYTMYNKQCMENYSQFSMKNKVWVWKRKVHIREADWAQIMEGFVSNFKKLSLYLLESLSGYKFRNDTDQFAFYFFYYFF